MGSNSFAALSHSEINLLPSRHLCTCHMQHREGKHKPILIGPWKLKTQTHVILHTDGMYGSSVLAKINIIFEPQNLLIIWLFSQSINRLTDFPVAFTSSSFCNLHGKKKKKKRSPNRKQQLKRWNGNFYACPCASIIPKQAFPDTILQGYHGWILCLHHSRLLWLI